MKIVSELEFCPKCKSPYGFRKCRISGGGKPDRCLGCEIEDEKENVAKLPVDNPLGI